MAANRFSSGRRSARAASSRSPARLGVGPGNRRSPARPTADSGSARSSGLVTMKGQSAIPWIKDNQRIANGRPWAPQWLVDTLGADYFGCVVFVADGKSEWSDAEMV